MDLRSRIELFIKHTGLTPKEFERSVGLSNGSVSKMGDGTRRSTIDRISTVYPELNPNWLLTGEGEMLISEGTTVTGNGNAVNTITGNGNKVSASVAGDFADLAGKFATSLQIAQNQLTSSQSQLAKSQEQMDRLIALLEKVTSSKNP